MALSFPPSPTIGETYTANGRTWSWTGAAWELVGANAGITGATGVTGATGPAGSGATGATGPAGTAWEIPTFSSYNFTAVNKRQYYTAPDDSTGMTPYDIADPATGDYYFFWNPGNNPNVFRVGGVTVPAGRLIARVFSSTLAGAQWTTYTISNATGTSGATGPTGATGPAGSSGSAGATGATGPGVASNITGITGASAITNIVSLSASAYAAIGSPSATTLYIVTG